MRNGLIGLVSAMVLAPAMATNGCGGSSSGTRAGNGGSPNGGSNGNGGSAGTSQPGECSNAPLCGGSVVGTWNVTASCLNVAGELDMTLVSASCPSAPVTGSLHVTGTWTVNSDGTYSDNTTTLGAEQFTLGSACLNISSTPVTCDGIATLDRTPTASQTRREQRNQPGHQHREIFRFCCGMASHLW